MIFMKRIASSIAVLGLSACLLAGSVLPAFAAAPAAVITGHQASTCHDLRGPLHPSSGPFLGKERNLL
mgnify:CR=1 FL=1